MSFAGLQTNAPNMVNQQKPTAVLWDLDGTLVDTEPAWMAGEQAMAAAYGGEWTQADALNVVGLDLRDTANYVRARLNITLSDDDIIADLGGHVIEALKTRINWRPGAVELFEHLNNKGIPQGLVTMSYRPIAQPVIDALDFQAIVTGDIVTNGKPHPEPYLRGAELLGQAPQTCVAIEDSPTGTKSARDAGCVVLAIPNMLDVPAMPGQVVLSSLTGLKLPDLAALFE